MGVRVLGKEVWVLVEHRQGEIEEVSLEILSEARRLAKKARLEVCALILGCPGDTFADRLGQYGADRVYVLEHELLKHYTTEGYTAALEGHLRTRRPSILLLAATSLGRDLAPRLATRLRVGLVSGCRVLDVDREGAWELSRPSCGGRIYAKMKCPLEKLLIATVTPGVLGVGKPMRGWVAKIEQLDVDLRPEIIRTRVVAVRKVDRRELDITEAEIVVAFGRGLVDGSGLPEVDELASIMGASLAGSRAAVDEGWISFDRQIGQTGKTISPRVILCCGISGAQQFVMGMRDSGFIVAINTDRRAPILNFADVSVLGDLHAIVPELTKRLREAAEKRSSCVSYGGGNG